MGEEPNHKTAIKPGLITHFKLSALPHFPSANFIVSLSPPVNHQSGFFDGKGGEGEEGAKSHDRFCPL